MRYKNQKFVSKNAIKLLDLVIMAFQMRHTKYLGSLLSASDMDEISRAGINVSQKVFMNEFSVGELASDLPHMGPKTGQII